MLSCKNITQKADDYIEGRLSSGERLSLRIHLTLCIHCRRYIRQLSVSIVALRRIPFAKPCNDNEIERILDRLKQEQQK